MELFGDRINYKKISDFFDDFYPELLLIYPIIRADFGPD